MSRNDHGCHIEARWIEMSRYMVPIDASPDQVTDMRLMFFCGAITLYDLINRMLQRKPDESSTAFMQALHVELEAFMVENGSGRLDS